MPTPIEARVTLAQWLSPAYPTGGFAWSHGLETEVAEGRVTDRASFAAWLADVLDHGLGRTDAVLLAEAHRAAPEELPALDAEARAFAPSAERLAETAEQGAAFARTTAAVWGLDLPPLTHPVAVGRAAALMGLPLPDTLALYLHAVTASLASAAQRLVPLGQTEAQAAVARLAPLCARLADEAETRGRDDLSSAAWAADIAAMRHETLQPRLFRS
jgi:urease accessory protein